MSTPQQFALQMDAFIQKAKGNMDKVVRKVVIDIGTRVVMRSPVGDPSHWMHPAPKGYTGGHFRANWQYGENARPDGISGAIDKSGQVSISRITGGVQPGAAGKVHYIVNNLPYAMRLETGWSKQAPAGMVGITVREYQAIVARAAEQTRSAS